MPQAPAAFQPTIIPSKGGLGQALLSVVLLVAAAGCRADSGDPSASRRGVPSPAAALAATPAGPSGATRLVAVGPAGTEAAAGNDARAGTDVAIDDARATADAMAQADARATVEAQAAADARAMDVALAAAGLPATDEALSSAQAPAPATQTVSLAAGAPERLEIPGLIHTWQKWNNCGPSSISMALSAYGLRIDQLAAAADLKPDREDTNVSPEELANYARGQGLRARAGVGGDLDLVLGLLRAGVPVLAEQWIGVEGRGEMGHYRVLSGYDDAARQLIAQDSYYGANQRFDYAEFEAMWRPFLGAYVIAWRPEQDAAVRSLLGEEADVDLMWRRVLAEQRAWVEREPGSAWAQFALGEALSQTGDPVGAVAAFDRARAIGLPFRAFWYQFGYYRALFETGDHARMIALADETLAPMKGENLEESHYWKGRALEGLGRREDAMASYRRALEYNPLFAPAAAALAAAAGG